MANVSKKRVWRSDILQNKSLHFLMLVQRLSIVMKTGIFQNSPLSSSSLLLTICVLLLPI